MHPIALLHFLSVSATVCALLLGSPRVLAQPDESKGMPLIFSDDFEKGRDRWDTTDDASWYLHEEDGKKSFGLNKRISDYQPKVRSPHNIALIKDLKVSDFVLTFRVRSTKDTGNHRDCCVFFCHQDTEHFYYAHLGAKPDPASGQIMIVNGEPRRPLTDNRAEVAWDDKWHTVKVTRDSVAGTIEVFFDNVSKPHLIATDKTFGEGRIGIGSFDDMNDFDDVRLFGKIQSKESPTAKKPPERPTPTFADVAYGTDSERQKFDFWRANSEKPTPLVLLIHGGGWVNGDKSSYGNRPIKTLLDAGISVAAINYRFIAQAMEQKVEPPVKACVHDAARALQTIRSKAREWNIDSNRVGATGGSAGACTSLWLALHKDLADPSHSDLIARQSSRLSCAAVTGAQTSLDAVELRRWISNSVYGGHAFGFAKKGRSRAEEFDLLIENREKVLPWIREYSPIELVSKDDPALFLEYPNQKTEPVFGGTEPDPTHSAIYGIEFAKRCQESGVECIVSYPGKQHSEFKTSVDFLIAKLKAN